MGDPAGRGGLCNCCCSGIMAQPGSIFKLFEMKLHEKCF